MPKRKTLQKFLTKTVCDAAKPYRDRDKYIWDKYRDRESTKQRHVTGLALRVRVGTGYKSFIYQYRLHGRAGKLTLGKYGPLTVHQARKKALEAARLVEKGVNPNQRKRQLREPLEIGDTVNTLCDRYLKDHASTKRPKTAKEAARRIEQEIRPAIGTRPIAEVAKSEVVALYMRVRRERGGYEANRMLALVKHMFNLAVSWDLLGETHRNPAVLDRSILFKESRRKTKPKDDAVPTLLSKIEEEPDPHFKAIWRLLLATGLRSSEIRERQWSDIDWSGREMTLEHSKGHESDRKVPLSRQAMEILEELRRHHRVVGSPYLFPSRTKPREAPISRSWTSRRWHKVREAAGLPLVRQHDLRHLVVHHLAKAGNAAQIIQQAVGHKSIATTMRYIHELTNESRAALDKMGDSLHEIGSTEND